MANLVLPLGPLVSFATTVFGGALAPQNVTGPPKADLGYKASLKDSGNGYPIDLQRWGGAPKADTSISWDYEVFAADGLSEAAAYQSIEDQLNAIALAADGTYVYGGTGGPTVSGQKGDLVVQSAHGGNYKATARFLGGKFSSTPGEVTGHVTLTLAFVVLTPFSPA